MTFGLAFGIFLTSIAVAIVTVVVVVPLILGFRLDELHEIWEDDDE